MILFLTTRLDICGKDCATKSDEFSEKFQKGGRVIFNAKIYIADFGPLKRDFFGRITKKLQYNFQKMRRVPNSFGFFPKTK